MRAVRFVLAFVTLAGSLAAAQITRVPVLNLPVVPSSVSPGGADFTLTVNGTGFAPGVLLSWQGHQLKTVFVSSSQLKAQIPGNLITNPGTISINAQNPGARVSNAGLLQVIEPSAVTGVPASSGISAGVSLKRVVVADFNGDTLADIAASDAAGSVAVLLGRGDGTFQAAAHYHDGISPLGIIAADFNQDKKLDIAVTNSGAGNSVSVFLNNGDGTFQAATSFDTGANPVALTAADLDADGSLDLVVCNHSDATVSVLLGNGDGTFQPQTTFPVGEGPSSVVAADFGGDSQLDLAVANQMANSVSILRGNGAGNFRPKVDVSVGAGPLALVTADFNRDGVLDLATANNGDGSVSLLIGRSDGTFRAPASFATLRNPDSLAVGDVNGDGKLDLAIADATNLSLLLGNGNGGFVQRTDYAAKKYFGLSAGDFNGDGRLDFAAVGATQAADVLLQSAVSLSATSADFGSQGVGTESDPRTDTLRNLATTDLHISGIKVVGVNAADFSQTNDCGDTVTAGGSCHINIVFTPSATGPRSASIQIRDDAVGGSQTISLTGTGQ